MGTADWALGPLKVMAAELDCTIATVDILAQDSLLGLVRSNCSAALAAFGASVQTSIRRRSR
jgi:hypothetical protein